MTEITERELDEFLAVVAVDAAASGSAVGRELRYRPAARRTIVLHFGVDDSADYIASVVSILLTAAEAWVLVPRHGSASQLDGLFTSDGAEALSLDASDRERLCSYLCTRDMSLASVSVDLYLVSRDGDVLVTWDHHSADEGICVELRDISRANALLMALNTCGVELEVFFTE